MTKGLILSILLVLLGLVPARAGQFEPVLYPNGCPNMNGHFRHKQFLAKADVYFDQQQCDSLHLQIKVVVAGKQYVEEVTNPLDGVSRSVPSQSADEKDFASMKFTGDTLVVVVDRYVTESGSGTVTHTTNKVEGNLLDYNNLALALYDVDGDGNSVNKKDYDFQRVQSRVNQ